MSQESTNQALPEKPFFHAQAVYHSNLEKKRFFRQNSPSAGTYMECWIRGNEFTHILSTVELGTAHKLSAWLETKQLKPSTESDYYAHFFWLCRQMDIKRNSKNDKRQFDVLGI